MFLFLSGLAAAMTIQEAPPPASTPRQGAAGRLTEQRVIGARRICIYGFGRDTQNLRVGRGEPCPQRYRAPEVETSYVPSMAIRSRQFRANGSLICIYRYAGRDYRTSLPVTATCPLTPIATMQSLTTTR